MNSCHIETHIRIGQVKEFLNKPEEGLRHYQSGLAVCFCFFFFVFVFVLFCFFVCFFCLFVFFVFFFVFLLFLFLFFCCFCFCFCCFLVVFGFGFVLSLRTKIFLHSLFNTPSSSSPSSPPPPSLPPLQLARKFHLVEHQAKCLLHVGNIHRSLKNTQMADAHLRFIYMFIYIYI